MGEITIIRAASPIPDSLEFQLERRIIGLTKKFLESLEEFNDNKIYLENLIKRVGLEENLKDRPDYSKIRKAMLDLSNDSIRELKAYVENFNYSFKN